MLNNRNKIESICTRNRDSHRAADINSLGIIMETTIIVTTVILIIIMVIPANTTVIITTVEVIAIDTRIVTIEEGNSEDDELWTILYPFISAHLFVIHTITSTSKAYY